MSEHPWNKFPRLSERLIDLLIDGVKTMGLNEDAYGYIEERLYVDEAEAVENFFKWLVANNKTFGHGNIKQIWKEWVASQSTTASQKLFRLAKQLEAKTVTLNQSMKTRVDYDETDPETAEFAQLWIARKKDKPGAKEKFEAAGIAFLEGKAGFVGSGHWKYEYKGNIFEISGYASGRGFWGTDYSIRKAEKKAVAASKRKAFSAPLSVENLKILLKDSQSKVRSWSALDDKLMVMFNMGEIVALANAIGDDNTAAEWYAKAELYNKQNKIKA